MKPEIDNSDWREAFGYAGEPDTYAHNGAKLSGVLGYVGSLAPFTREDVDHIEQQVPGENDGPSWIIYGRLRDGRWFYLAAGCDYTGWDCQAGGSATIAHDRETIIRMAIPKAERERFGLPEPEPRA